MPKITDVRFDDCQDSPYIRPKRMHFLQDGQPRAWDMVHVHDTVAILLFDRSREELILVRQFRPPVYLRNDDGYTYELCAGLVDKDKSLEEIIQDEAWEECGYRIPLAEIHKMNSFYTSIGFAASRQTIFYAFVDQSMQYSDGGGNAHEREQIEVVRLPIQEARALIYNEAIAKTSGLMYAFYWFFEQFYPQLLSEPQP